MSVEFEPSPESGCKMPFKTNATKIEALEKDTSTNVTKIASVESQMKKFDKILIKIWNRLEALESSSCPENKQEAPSRGSVEDLEAIEERLTILELEAQKNREYFENNDNSIQNIEEKMKQSEKTLENFGDIMLTTEAEKDLEKKVDNMKVDCEISNKKVERFKKKLVLIENDMKSNLLKTNKKLDKKYESIRKTTKNNFKSIETQSRKFIDHVDSIKSVVDGITGDLEDNIKLDVTMMKSILTKSHCKIESTNETVNENINKEQKFYCKVCNRLFKEEFSVWRHVNDNHPQIKQISFNCQKCGKKFMTKDDLLVHKNKFHRVPPFIPKFTNQSS